VNQKWKTYFLNSLKFVSREETELNELIYQTIVHLPEEVREFVCDRCRFLSIGGSANALVLRELAPPFHLCQTVLSGR